MASALLGGLKAAAMAVRPRIAAHPARQTATKKSNWGLTNLEPGRRHAKVANAAAARIQQTIKGARRMASKPLSSSVTNQTAAPRRTSARKKRSRKSYLPPPGSAHGSRHIVLGILHIMHGSPAPGGRVAVIL